MGRPYLINIAGKKLLKYVLFFNLYASEGMIFALSTVITVLYFNELNIPIAKTTLVAGIINTPWILKFVPGPLIDHCRKIGRKPFIIIGGLVGSLCLFPLALLDPAHHVIPFTILFFTSHLGIVFLDVTADAWAIETTAYSERGKVNGAMTAGLFSSWALSNIFFAFIGQSMGYPLVFVIAGFFILFLLIMPFFVKEEKRARKRQKVGAILVREFRKKNTILVTSLEFVAALNFGILLFIIPDYVKNVLLLDDAQTGLLSAIYPISIVIGTIIGGTCSDRYGRKRILLYSFIGSIVFSTLFIFADTWQLFSLVYALSGLFQGTGVYAALAALAMDITNPKIGATQYSILATVHNFGDIGIAIFSGALVSMLGYARFFPYAAWTVGPALLILYLVKETKQ
jgi:MFS family permease